MKHYSHNKTGATENNCQQSWSQKTNSRLEIKRDAIKVDLIKKNHNDSIYCLKENGYQTNKKNANIEQQNTTLT